MVKTHRSAYLAKRSKHGTRKTSGSRNSIHKFHKYIVVNFLSMLNTIKLYHWNTHSYATHKATDELYSKMNEHIDTFVEVLLGKTGDRVNMSSSVHITLKNCTSQKELVREMERCKTCLVNLENNPALKSMGMSNSDLFNIRDEILADINQFLYLLTFK